MDTAKHSHRMVRKVVVSLLSVIGFIVICLPSTGHSKAVGAGQITFDAIADKALELSKQTYQPPSRELPESLKKIGYDEWRDVRFRPAKSLWRGEPFSVQFFHRGFIYHEPVRIHVVDSNGVRELRYNPDLFDLPKNYPTDVPDDFSFAGFRIHYPVNTPKYADELISFLGASYFRALGKNHSYGMSARGLAVNTATDLGEEFPYFTEFWLVRPDGRAKTMTVYALLDSESLTGAYQFIIQPGEETVVYVRSKLFVRKKTQKLGIAPLTSMFDYGENSGFKGSSDFRPEVHDSDGLLIHGGTGEWLWHPVVNPHKLLINSFSGPQPKGFGLIQRDVNFDHYLDLEARYESRPSVWVVPQGDWGAGHIELLQLPTPNEYNDNLGAWWVPERTPEPGDVLEFSYELVWHSAHRRSIPVGTTSSTRVVRKDNAVMFVVDFHNLPSLKGFDPLADVWVSEGYTLTGYQVIANPYTNGWRLVLHVAFNKEKLLDELLPNDRPAMELRAFLKDSRTGKPVTETWSYTHLP